MNRKENYLLIPFGSDSEMTPHWWIFKLLFQLGNNMNIRYEVIELLNIYQSASNLDQSHSLIALESESHELFKNSIKRLRRNWNGG